MASKPKVGQLVELLWTDAMHTSGWVSGFEFDPTVAYHKTAGYVLDWDKDWVSVCQSRAMVHDSVDSVMSIPRKMIVDWRIMPGRGEVAE